MYLGAAPKCVCPFYKDKKMAFDGICVAGLVRELNALLTDSHISKIYQPEADELNIVFKTPKTEEHGRGNVRLLLSASATLPLVYVMEDNKTNPLTAPNFCMLLRKYIGSGRVVSVTQPGLERIIEFNISHLDEMGDERQKKLIIELMGKHSNIIFVDDKGMIVDSIKHIGAQISSVREVFPGREYVYPPVNDKLSPFEVNKDVFYRLLEKPDTVSKALLLGLQGFSFSMLSELSYRAEVDGEQSTAALSVDDKERLFGEFERLIADISTGSYSPSIYYDGEEPKEFSALPFTMLSDLSRVDFPDCSAMVRNYYSGKESFSRMRQKSSDLRRIVSNAIERAGKKYDLQMKQLKDTDKREKFKVYGELIHTYGYGVEEGAKEFKALNYYTNEEITIPLDPTISVMENGKKYFDRYDKLKRTYDALVVLTKETKAELDYLLSVQNALDIAASEADLTEIKEELIESGFIRAKRQTDKKKREEKAKPLHFISSDGFHMYVGKNNLQNDHLTFSFANAGDMWFHAKKMPGSHVIVRLEGAGDLPDATYNEAGRLAAYFSSGKTSPKVEIDYTRRGELKKPPGAKPGYVIYHKNYSMISEPDIKGIEEVKQ